MSRPRPAPRAPRRCRPQVSASLPPPARAVPRGARHTATGRNESPPGDPGVGVCGPRAAVSTRPEPRRPAPHPLGPSVRRRPDAPGSAGGAARESPHRAPSEWAAALGAEPGSLARAQGRGSFGLVGRVAREICLGPSSGGPGVVGSVDSWSCLPESRGGGWGELKCATCLEPGQHPAATAGFEPQTGNGRQPWSTAGEGVPR